VRGASPGPCGRSAGHGDGRLVASGSGRSARHGVASCLGLLVYPLQAAGGDGRREGNRPGTVHHPPESAVTAVPLLLARNPDKASESPEITRDEEKTAWTETQLASFLAWCDVNDPAHADLWRVYADTWCRRGEVLALTWGDLDGRRVKIVKTAQPATGQRARVGQVKNARSARRAGRKPGRTVTLLWQDTADRLAARKRERGSLHLSLAQPDALAFSDHNGRVLRPTATSGQFERTLRRYIRDADPDMPYGSLHSLRHTGASLGLAWPCSTARTSRTWPGGWETASPSWSRYTSTTSNGARTCATWTRWPPLCRQRGGKCTASA